MVYIHYKNGKLKTFPIFFAYSYLYFEFDEKHSLTSRRLPSSQNCPPDARNDVAVAHWRRRNKQVLYILRATIPRVERAHKVIKVRNGERL